MCGYVVRKKPTFLLFLDAKSAFDAVYIPYLIRNLFFTGMEGQSVLYMDNRLKNRKTFCEFDKILVGPIHDERGLEQGGVSSSDHYKLYNNELLNLVQESQLGVDMGGSPVFCEDLSANGATNSGSFLVISGVGQADDTALMSNDLNKLKHILQLALNYCIKYNVQLCPSKTKLLVIPPSGNQNFFVPYSPIAIDGKTIDFVDQAEHVGVLRSINGNLPNILQRISSFKKSLGSVVSCGLARGSRSNPCSSLRILTLHGTPVLMSGLASLVLSDKEVACIDQQLKKTLQNILKLSVNTPSSFVHFIAGTLPGTAVLHLKQLSLFGMICRLPDDPLNVLARQVLITSSSTSSWFIQVRNLCLRYQLPHPLHLLNNPPTKEAFKKLVKAKVLDSWETKLRNEASPLLSLTYFNPNYMSLTKPHKIWTTAGPKPYEVAKARIQLRFLGSQYPSAKHSLHWTPENPLGLCSFPDCQGKCIVESSEHILLSCPAYTTTRAKLICLCLRIKNPISHSLVTNIVLSNSNSKIMQFLLDCTPIPEVIDSAQRFGDIIYNDLFYISRTWCFAIHRERMKRLCRWNFR